MNLHVMYCFSHLSSLHSLPPLLPLKSLRTRKECRSPWTASSNTSDIGSSWWGGAARGVRAGLGSRASLSLALTQKLPLSSPLSLIPSHSFKHVYSPRLSHFSQFAFHSHMPLILHLSLNLSLSLSFAPPYLHADTAQLHDVRVGDAAGRLEGRALVQEILAHLQRGCTVQPLDGNDLVVSGGSRWESG